MKKSLLLLSVFLLTSCNISHEEENVIYTSFYPIYDFTKRIVGNHFDVVNLTPYGSEPHDYEPKAKEVVRMTTCKALFLNGLSLEPYQSTLPDEIQKKTYIVTKNIDYLYVDNVLDSHVWLSLDNAIAEMRNICDIVSDIDPDNKDEYEKNYEYQRETFLSLKREYLEKFSSVSNRYLVVSHAAFGYLCKEFNLTQIYVSGLTPDDEPSPKALENIIESVKEYHVSTIFYEELVSNEISMKIAKETGVKVMTLNPLEGISKEDEGKEDYLSVMRKNYESILEACKS
jgi:zinc transport system substrate-binding protein